MNRLLFFLCFQLVVITCFSQNMVTAANQFINSLDTAQKTKALYPFDSDERYNFHFFPKEDRKGITMNELNAAQKNAALHLMKSCLSDEAVKKVQGIMELENVLKSLEHRKPDDHYRDPGNYYFTVFGVPGTNTIWGWRLEGHHISFNFSADKNQLVGGTPGFLGANPAIVQEGPQKGKEVLKDEEDDAYALLHSLSTEEIQKALIDTKAPNDIITFISRKAMIEHPAGIRYADLTPQQQQQLLQLVNVYIHRYTRLFADNMLKEIQQAGLDNLQFAWTGSTESGIGHPHYYRIQGPTIIIEYDNTQNNGNHAHSVVRDLQHDFGGDLLLEHYKASHQ